MPNLYATPTEIKAAMPEAYASDDTGQDSIIYALSERISRLIDLYTNRRFSPYDQTMYFDGRGEVELWIPDLFSVTTVSNGTGSYDSDGNAEMSTDFGTADYLLYFGNVARPLGSYNRLLIHPEAANASEWTDGVDQVQITGAWCYHEDRANGWEDSGDTVQDASLTSDATTITVSDADGSDRFGFSPRFQVGQLIRIEDEYCEVTAVDASGNTLTVVRGVNGSTAAAHAQNTQIDIWRPVPVVKQVCIMESVRLLERGLQGYGDARVSPELGDIVRVASLDPQAEMMLMPYRSVVIAG